jgi:hypothetical protein
MFGYFLSLISATVLGLIAHFSALQRAAAKMALSPSHLMHD